MAQDLVESHPWAGILSPQFDSTAFWQSLCSYSEKCNHLYADSFPEVLTLLQDKIISWTLVESWHNFLNFILIILVLWTCGEKNTTALKYLLLKGNYWTAAGCSVDEAQSHDSCLEISRVYGEEYNQCERRFSVRKSNSKGASSQRHTQNTEGLTLRCLRSMWTLL